MRINGKVLKGARQRLEALGHARDISGFSGEQLGRWQDETDEPSYSQAISLAGKLGIPFGYLFLSDTPKKPLGLPDLRTIAAQSTRKPSLGLIAVIDDAIRKQHWYSDILRGQQGSRREFVGKYSVRDNTAKIASDIRQHIRIDEQMRAEITNRLGYVIDKPYTDLM